MRRPRGVVAAQKLLIGDGCPLSPGSAGMRLGLWPANGLDYALGPLEVFGKRIPFELLAAEGAQARLGVMIVLVTEKRSYQRTARPQLC